MFFFEPLNPIFPAEDHEITSPLVFDKEIIRIYNRYLNDKDRFDLTVNITTALSDGGIYILIEPILDEARQREEVEKKIREIGRVMVDYTSELLYPRNIAKYIRNNTAFTDDEILELLEAIDSKYVERFGENYDRIRDTA